MPVYFPYIYACHTVLMSAIALLDSYVSRALLLNGVYDVACALCMLWLPASLLGRLHLSVFSRHTKDAHRLLAYWVLTYGLDRIIAGLWRSPPTDAIAALSYLVEAAAYYNEASVHNSVHVGKASFVYLTSLVLSALVALRMCIAHEPPSNTKADIAHTRRAPHG
jgi:hypothetical protein